MNLDKAKRIAEKYKSLLKPHCERIEIGGSIRRGRKEVGDIELVCIPRTILMMNNPQQDIFTDEGNYHSVRDEQFIKLVNSFARVKGNGEGKYCQIYLEEEINLDLFMTTPEQWGVIFMIRTGSALFTKRMVTEIKQNGFYVSEGFLWQDHYREVGHPSGEGIQIPVYEEKDFFEITGQEYVKPELRVM